MTPRGGDRPSVLPALIGAAMFAAPTLASAQLVTQTVPNTYTPLPAPTILTTDVDDGDADVTPPFPITFYGVQHTGMSVGYNGAIYFPSGRFVTLSNATPGAPGSPNDWIGPFWDDLRLYSSNGGYIGHQVQGTAPNRTFTVEWNNISRFGASAFTFSMQVRFFEGQDRVEVDYGPVAGSASPTATMAMEDASGANALLFAPSQCTTSCGVADLQAMANMRVIVAQPPEPQLTGSFGPFPRGLQPGSTGSGQIVLTNSGTNTATSVANNIWLSTDNALDAQDILIGTHVGDIANGDTTVTASISVPAMTPVGSYFVILEVDAPDAWSEIDETNNVIVAQQRFDTAFDLQPAAVTILNQGGVNAGDTIIYEIQIQNNGISYSGPLEIGLFASADQVIDAADTSVAVVSVNLTGAGNTETVQVSGTLPTLSPGSYYPFVTLDPNDVIVESNENNNQLLANTTFDTGPDFAVGAIDVPGSVQPGSSANITTTIDSVAVAFTGNVPYRLYASEDDTLDTMMDIDLGLFNAAFAGEMSLDDVEAVPFPASIPSGRYYVIAVVDPLNTIVEVSTANNEGVSTGQIVNATDFFAENVSSSPSALEIGQDVTVSATARNTGLPFTGNVRYSVYVSPDDTFDPGDQPVYTDLVFFPGTDTGTPIDVTFPLEALPGDSQIRPGSYTIIVRLDSTDVHAEADEDNNWDAGGRVTLQGADLVVNDIDASGVAFIGLPLRVTIEIENEGVADARGFTYSYFLSDNDIIRVNDRRIFTSQTTTIASGATQTFEDFVNLPTLTSSACLWLGVIVNDNERVAETSVSNNTRRIFDCIEIVFPIPDLTAQIIDTPTVAAAGEEFAVTRLIGNIGTADAPTFSYTYYLSSNPTISNDDIPIGTFSGAVPTGSDDYGIDVLQIPSTVAQGSYYVGMILDPDELVAEVDDTNNTAIGPQLPVFGAAIRFITDNLANATVGVDYNVGVYARGGPLPITWSVSRGTLPPGLDIGPDSGIISGQPTEEGLYEFVLRASAGTAFAEKPFSIRVTSPTVDLRVATAALPTAIAGREYSAQLVAVGGQIPYTWSAVSLPAGMELSEDGLLSGIPEQPGPIPVTVRVSDTLGTPASRELVLNVISPSQTLQVVQIPLPDAVIGTEYCEPEPIGFEAENGTPPYRWSIVGDAPAGMSLSVDGDLCGVPERVGRFPITVRVQDSTGLFDTSLFILEVDDGTGLSISTFSLEDAQVGEAYTSSLTVSRPQPGATYEWSVVDGTGDLPPGLSLSSDGAITGTPGQSGTYAFTVQVVDDALRLDVQPLSIRVEPAPEPVSLDDDGGCTCVTDESDTEQPWGSMLTLLGFGGVVLLRRRRGPGRVS